MEETCLPGVSMRKDELGGMQGSGAKEISENVSVGACSQMLKGRAGRSPSPFEMAYHLKAKATEGRGVQPLTGNSCQICI